MDNTEFSLEELAKAVAAEIQNGKGSKAHQFAQPSYSEPIGAGVTAQMKAEMDRALELVNCGRSEYIRRSIAHMNDVVLTFGAKFKTQEELDKSRIKSAKKKAETEVEV